MYCFQESHLTSLRTAILAKESESRLVEIWLKLVNHTLEDLSRYQDQVLLPVLETSGVQTAGRDHKRVRAGAHGIVYRVYIISSYNHMFMFYDPPVISCRCWRARPT